MPARVTVPWYIGLGGNLGEPRRTFRRAADLLTSHRQVRIQDHSALYRTAPQGGPPGQPDFLNAVLAVSTTLPPEELLGLLLAIEAECGRQRRERWGPRTLDLDLLLCGTRVIERPGLRVPHPHLHERLFVLAPLADLAAGALHPLLGRCLQELRDDLFAAGGQQVTLIEPRGWLLVLQR